MVDPDILAKDQEFRASSEAAKETLLRTSRGVIKSKQRDFIFACGGKIKFDDNFVCGALEKVLARESSAPDEFKKVRENYPNAYLPWNKMQDEKLRELFSNGSRISDLAKVFNRTGGAIRSRLIKLGLLADKYKTV